MPSNRQTKSVLLVDDDQDFLALAAEFLGTLSNKQWMITRCSSGGEALGRMQQSPADLIVFDIRMPVLDGVQLLGLLQRRFPTTLKVVLTGAGSSEQRAACLTAGADLVLDKPLDRSGWNSIYAALESLLSSPKDDGFRGVLRKVSLPDVIQMECLAANSSILEITGAGMRGRLYIKTGQIIHGEIGDLTGVEALNSLLCLPGGSFNLVPFQDPGRETISGQWEFLLMEAARVRDESLANATEVVEADIPPEAPAWPTEEDVPELDDWQPEEAATHPAETPTEKSPAPASKLAGQTGESDTSTGTQPVVKETLICSLQGELLYEWNCPDPLERIVMLEFISKRSANMAAAAPLGALERFEFIERGVRCVFRLEGDQALFVRTQSVLPAGPQASSATP